MRSNTIAFIVGVLCAAAIGTAQAQDSGIKQFGRNLGSEVVEGLKAGLIPAADKDFLNNAASGGIAEVTMARVALEEADSPAVKRHAQKVLNDHTQANDELRRIATSKGITLPDVPSSAHQAMVDKVRAAPARDFDETYVREAGIRAHQEMRILYRNQSSSGVDPELKAFAARTLPTVESHLTHAERIEDDLRDEAR